LFDEKTALDEQQQEELREKYEGIKSCVSNTEFQLDILKQKVVE